MAVKFISTQATPIAHPPIGPVEAPVVSFLGSNSTTALINLEARAPFSSIQTLFDHLHEHPHDAAMLNATYPHRGIIKTAALHKPESDQKFKIDLSPMRISRIPEALRQSLDTHGLGEVLDFFNGCSRIVEWVRSPYGLWNPLDHLPRWHARSRTTRRARTQCCGACLVDSPPIYT